MRRVAIEREAESRSPMARMLRQKQVHAHASAATAPLRRGPGSSRVYGAQGDGTVDGGDQDQVLPAEADVDGTSPWGSSLAAVIIITSYYVSQ